MTGSSGLIVLGHTKFGESSVVLHTLGNVYGRRSFLVKVGKRTGMAMFLPLSILEADITENSKSTLWTARNFSSQCGLAGIRGNIYKNAMSMFMAEVLFRTLKEGSCEEGLYDWCCGQIMTLDALKSDFSNFHLLFLLGLASSLGFRPRFEDLIPFIGSNSGADASRPFQMHQLVSLPLDEAMLLPLTGQARSGICEDILRYISFHCETPINVRSLPVLKELFM